MKYYGFAYIFISSAKIKFSWEISLIKIKKNIGSNDVCVFQLWVHDTWNIGWELADYFGQIYQLKSSNVAENR